MPDTHRVRAHIAQRFQHILELIDSGAIERAEHALRHDALPTLQALGQGDRGLHEARPVDDRTPLPLPRLEAGPLSIDVDGRAVWLDGHELHLPFREFALIEHFARHANRVCTRRAPVAAIWKDRPLASMRTVDIHVYRLRHKLAPYDPLIETVRNVGYVLRVPPGAMRAQSASRSVFPGTPRDPSLPPREALA